MGDLIMPLGLDDIETVAYNEAVLLKRLNEPDAFDVDLAPQRHDRLLVAIRTGDGPSTYQFYGFEWQRGRWVSRDYKVFDWMSEHDEVKVGKLRTALQSKAYCQTADNSLHLLRPTTLLGTPAASGWSSSSLAPPWLNCRFYLRYTARCVPMKNSAPFLY